MLVASIAGAPLTRAIAAEQCFTDWSEAAPIVAREKLRSAREVQALIREQHSGDVVRLVLCRVAGGYRYRVMVRHDDGKIAKVLISATPMQASR